MRLYLCDQKIILRIYNQGIRFIKDYSTNTAAASQSAFIDVKGRIVAFFDQHRVNEDEMWVVMERKAFPVFQEKFSKYLYLTDVKIEPLETRRVYWDLDKEVVPGEGDVFIPAQAGRLWLTASKPVSNVSKAQMNLFRVKNNIPWQGIDFNEEMVLCVAEEGRISFLKGCYLGQEVVARVHYKGKPPKKLVVKLLRDCPKAQRPLLTSRVTDPATGDFIGFVFDKTGDAG